MTTLNVNLHPNQIDVFNDPARFKILICGRRWGKSTLAAYIVLIAALSKKNGTYFLVSPTYSQTSIIWRMIKKIIPMNLVEKIMEGDKYIQFKNGSLIFAKSGDSPDALRGEGLDGVVLDEAAMLKREVWEQAIRPALADKEGWAVFISTPKGRNYLFNLYLKGKNDQTGRYKSFKYTSYDNPFVKKEELDEMILGLPELEYRQEIMADFIEGSGTVFKHYGDVIADCLEEPIQGEYYYIGVDLGRHEDFTVITVGKLSDSRIVYMERFNKTDWNFIKERIEDVYEKYLKGVVFIDSTGMGDPIYEDLSTKINIVSIKFTQQMKYALINNLAIMIEQRRILLPNDPQLIEEFEAYTYKMMPSGTIQYGAPSGFHDDIVISVALAAYGLNAGGYNLIGQIEELSEDEVVLEDYDDMQDVSNYDYEDEPINRLEPKITYGYRERTELRTDGQEPS
jgi:phage FluMu gp28-like protein